VAQTSAPLPLVRSDQARLCFLTRADATLTTLVGLNSSDNNHIAEGVPPIVSPLFYPA